MKFDQLFAAFACGVLAFAAYVSPAETESAGVAPTHLTCEYRTDPVGLDADRPRLSWWIDPAAKEQRAYRIVADGLWDSGWVTSAQSVNVPYGGPRPGDLRRVSWRVNVRTDRGESGWSAPAHWVTGKRTWTARWIKSAPHADRVPADKFVIRARGDKPYDVFVNGNQAKHRAFCTWWGREEATNHARWRYADLTALLKNDGRDVIETNQGAVWERVTEVPARGAPAFRKRFRVARPVRRATLAISGLGFYEASLDGRRIGEKRLDPVPTNYDRRVHYSVYELGELSAGEHELTVLLGHGWYDVFCSAVWNWDSAPWRDDPKLLAELVLEHADGSRTVVATDETWRRIGNPVLYDCIREGEVIGPAPAIDEPAVLAAPPRGTLVAEAMPPTVVRREIAPRRMKSLGRGDWLVDFGENVAGWMRMKMRGLAPGDVVHVRYDERVGADFTPATNRVITWHFRYANGWTLPGEGGFQTDRYVASGAGEETYEPRFTYNGFRYVLVRGLKVAPAADDLRAVVLHTDFRDTGSFDCSDRDFLDVLKMADRSYRGNFANGFPTDCPHREKNGWTGDANLAAEFAQYCYGNTAAYESWLTEVCDAQRPDGSLPGIVPTAGWGFDAYGPVWDSVVALLPQTLARYRGDARAFARCRPAAERWLDFCAKNCRRDGIVTEGYGDHCAWKAFTSPHLVATAYFIAACDALGRTDLAAQSRTAARRAFYRGNGLWLNGSQTSQALALAFGLCEGDEERRATAEELVRAVHAADDHVDFGIVGSKHVFRELSEAGRTDLAFRMATQRTEPSFLYARDRGATTLMEEWGLSAPSQNHVMFGDIVAWAYQYLAGIRGVSDGFRRFTLAPACIPALDFVSARVETPYGLVESAWRRTNGRLEYRFTVPPGCRARVLWAGRDTECGPGRHELTDGSERPVASQLEPKGRKVPLGDIRSYSVVVPEGADVPTSFAAAYLAKGIGRLCGVTPPVETGRCTRTKAIAFEARPLAADQGYRIAATEGGVALTGGTRGPFYAVAALLEEDWGVRWYARDMKAPAYPRRPPDGLAVTPREYVPPFLAREPLHVSMCAGPEFLSFNRLMPVSYFHDIPLEYGGGIANWYFCHTYQAACPGEKYFKDHPEFFPLIDGRRTDVGAQGQRCFTAEGLPECFVKAFEAEYAKKPWSRIFSVTANDSLYGQCQCDACRALMAKENLVGAEMELANRVGRLVRAKHPDWILNTWAYSDTVEPTPSLCTEPNVGVFYAPILQRGGRNEYVPWRDEPDVVRQLTEWKKRTGTIFVWDYALRRNRPFPNFDVIADNARYWRETGVRYVFIEQFEWEINSLDRLKSWVYPKILWNPDWDVHALIAEFVRGYYGAAAADMQAYVDVQDAAWHRLRESGRIGLDDVVFTEADTDAMRGALERAYRAVRDDSVVAARVAREYAVFLHSRLRACRLGAEDRYERDLKLVRELCGTYGIAFLESPRKPPAEANAPLFRRWENRLNAVRGGAGALPQYSPETIVLADFIPWKHIVRVTDPAAKTGKPARYFNPDPRTTSDWLLQWPVADLVDAQINQADYVVRVRLRADIRAKHDPDDFAMGLYCCKEGKVIGGGKIRFRDLPKDGYGFVYPFKINMFTMAAQGYFYHTSEKLAPEDSLYVDYIECIPAKDFREPARVERLGKIVF